MMERPAGLLGKLWDKFAVAEGPTAGRECLQAKVVASPEPAADRPLNHAPANSLACNAAPIFIDLETRSTLDIEIGGRRYAYHPTTQLLSLVALCDDRVVVWTPLLEQPLPSDQLWPEGYEDCGIPLQPVETFAGPLFPSMLATAIAAGRVLCAHNAFGFDEIVWKAKGLPEPSACIDTLPAARAAGLPGKLDELGVRLLGRGKHAGAATMKRLSRPDAKGRFPAFTAESATELVRYNVADVLILSRVFEEVNGHGEADVIAVDRVVNERGMAFDVDLARALIRLDEQAAAGAAAAAEQATGGAIKASDLTRVAYLLEWLRSQGANLPDLQAGTIEQYLRVAKPCAAIAAVLEARLVMSRISTSKLQTALAVVHADGRLRDLLVYHGAHTGRWAGRGVQPQNLPGAHPALKDLPPLVSAASNFDRFRASLPAGVSVSAAVSALVRPCFCAAPDKVLCIADFAGIEARGVAWCAGEGRLLEQFAAGADVYCDLASRVFGFPVTRAHKRERGIGKRGILGCGYSMSAKRFAEYAAKDGIDLAAVGITAEQVVEAFRDAYPAIAGVRADPDSRRRERGIWRDVETAAIGAVVLGDSCGVACCVFSFETGRLVVTLPSGRRLIYRNARVEDRPTTYGGLLASPQLKPTLIYDGPEHLNTPTYGGKLVENVVQAICRDLLAQAILECEREGLPVVMHVHDEIVIEVPVNSVTESLHRLAVVMSTPPAWADGFPVEVEAFAAERYFKTAPAGMPAIRARNGQILP